LNEEKALIIKEDIESLCNRHGLWFTVEEDRKPGLSVIRFKEISIKITRDPGSR